MVLTEKGKEIIGLARAAFPTAEFSAKDLSLAINGTIAPAALASLAKKGFLIKVPNSSPAKYHLPFNIEQLLFQEGKNKGQDNTNLHKAKRAKNDEFYSRYDDVEAELMHYKEQFRDKTVYLPCDSTDSAFWQYFKDNFNELGLNRLIASYMGEDGRGYVNILQRGMGIHAFVDVQLRGNGDFRSQECVDLLDESDIVVTNPPFSRIKEFIPLLLEHKKKFLVMGPLNAVTYKEIFPYVVNQEIWSGHNSVKAFITPNNEIEKMGNVFWFTNMTNNKLETNLKLKNEYNPVVYKKFDAYDAINVDRVVDIPKDYKGAIGVPVSFFQGKYNPNQFKIIGELKHGSDGEYDFAKPIVDGKEKYTRLIIAAAGA